MSDARTVWHSLETRRAAAVGRERTGILLAVCLLCAMAAAEVLFLKFVTGPESVSMLAAAEAIAMPQ